jgi:predicted AAA+ superfamily ATPase
VLAGRLQYIAFAIAWEVGLGIFQSIIKPLVSRGSFEPLTLVLLERDQFQRYEQELVGALNNDEVLNVALTGGYGAGKSSLIKTFFERHPESETSYVSLATFSKDAPSPLPVSEAEHSRNQGPN